MANPKFLAVEKKVPYNLRLPQDLIDKLNAYAEITGNTTTNIINKALTDFMKDKTVSNDYLDNIGGVSLKIPYAVYQKKTIISRSFNANNLESYGDTFNSGEYAETYFAESFVIKKIPNNLDVWDSLLETYKASSSGNYLHEGIEFLIVPELCEYENRCFTDLTKYLYCIYFIVKKDFIVEIEYIPFLEAINKIKKCDNYLLLNHALEIKETLEERTETIENQIYWNAQQGKDYSEFDYIWTELNTIAKKFNSGNIIPINESRKEKNPGP